VSNIIVRRKTRKIWLILYNDKIVLTFFMTSFPIFQNCVACAGPLIASSHVILQIIKDDQV